MTNQASARDLSLYFGVFLSYALLALLFVWPLPLKATDHLTGDPAGDTGAYVWNAYVFSRNMAAGSSILETDRILSFQKESSLALHNNSLILSSLADPLIPAFGVIGSFNAALILLLVLNPFCAFLLAWYETKAWAPAWIAGALFGFSPFVSARVEGHMSLATAFALPLVVLLTRRAIATSSPLGWALTGGALALCAGSDPYYLVFGVIAVTAVWLFERVSLEPLPPADLPILRNLARVLGVSAGSALLWILVSGGGEFSLGSFRVGIRSTNNPVFLLTIAAALLLVGRYPRRVLMDPGALRALKFPALAGLVAAGLLFPWLSVAAKEVFSKGGTAAPLWRSSPVGVDLLSFFMPNPTHPWFRGLVEPWMTRERADAFIEGVASWTVSAILVAVFLIAFRKGSVPKFWIVFTGLFASLALGPFVVIGGAASHIPGPWAILRYVPGIGMVRSPSRFAVMAMLGFAILLAHVLATARLGKRRGAVLAAVGLLLGLETMGLPRRLFPASLPQRYQVVADDSCDVAVLRLPTGIKDGTRQRGRFSSETQFRQVFHGKRLLGGYLSRLNDGTIASYEQDPTIHALLDLSEGKTLSPAARREAVRGAGALARQVGIGFIAVNKAESSQDLRDFVQEAFRPRVIHKAWPFAISIPFGDDCSKGECGHRPGCPHRLPGRS